MDPQTKKRILIVEDEQDALTLFVDILKNAGFEIVSCLNGEQALAQLSTQKFDLMLLDIIMPVMDGITVLSEIKANPDKYNNPPTYMLTNIDSDSAIEKAVELGAKGYFLKSETNPDQLISMVTKYTSPETPATEISATGTPATNTPVAEIPAAETSAPQVPQQ